MKEIILKGYDYDDDVWVDLTCEMEGCFIRSKGRSTMTYVAWCDEPFTIAEFDEAYKREYDEEWVDGVE